VIEDQDEKLRAQVKTFSSLEIKRAELRDASAEIGHICIPDSLVKLNRPK
jgi:hypothetical protein